VYAPALLSAGALEKRWALCAAALWPERLPDDAGAPGQALWIPVGDGGPRLYEALGYPPLRDSPIALRADHLERLGRELGRGPPPPVVSRWLGTTPAETSALVASVRAALDDAPRRGRRRARRLAVPH
jgi:hypothetical protein